MFQNNNAFDKPIGDCDSSSVRNLQLLSCGTYTSSVTNTQRKLRNNNVLDQPIEDCEPVSLSYIQYRHLKHDASFVAAVNAQCVDTRY